MTADRDGRAQRAAENAVDQDRLLPNEDPASRTLEDVEHWVAVYTELLAGKARLLDVLLQQMEATRQEDATREFVGDQTMMLAEIDRFQRRLRFWHDREMEVRGQPSR